MSVPEQLIQLRAAIDAVDQRLVDALAERLDICRRVAELKRVENIAMMQPDRVDAVKRRCAELGVARGLRPDFVRALFQAIIDEACELEDHIIENQK